MGRYKFSDVKKSIIVSIRSALKADGMPIDMNPGIYSTPESIVDNIKRWQQNNLWVFPRTDVWGGLFD